MMSDAETGVFMRLRLFCISLALGVGALAYGHSGTDAPVYVSLTGDDAADCATPATACRSIDQAMERVGKGGVVRIASGPYRLTDPSTLFAMLSGIVDVEGGIDPETGLPGTEPSTLIGVPTEFREPLMEKGFRVIADRKASADKTQSLITQYQSLQSGVVASPCVGGLSGGLPCDGVELLAHLPLGAFSATPVNAADIWGFVDLNTYREYAIVGFGNGVAVVDVSDLGNPREIGFVNGQQTTWRDIKVYQFFNAETERYNAYAYITTDGAGDGLFIVDLTELPQRISRVNYVGDFAAAHNVFALNLDYSTGLPLTDGAPGLAIAGSSATTGIVRAYSLEDPRQPLLSSAPSPVEGSCGLSGCYMHDAASMIIRDSRKDQCPNAADYCEVMFDFNEDTVDVWDVTDIERPVRLSRTPYVNSEYTHSGWPTEDGRFLFVHDELDERFNSVSATTVRTLSLADLTAPSFIGQWTGPTNAIDHNGFVRGNRYYMSHYTDGLTILDITAPDAPVATGFLDTSPVSSRATFNGAWGAYPFFPSDTIAVSDIENGLFLARDLTRNVPQGRFEFEAPSYAVEEAATVALSVARVGGSSGVVSVDYELLHASTSDSDVVLDAGSLNWSDGDTASKAITLAALGDGQPESLEGVFVRLKAPTGGATIGALNFVPVFVADSGAPASVRFANDVTAEERGFGSAVVTIQREGNATGPVEVDWRVVGGSATNGTDFSLATSGTIAWDDGDARPRVLEIDINDDGVPEGDETIEIQLVSAVGASIAAQDTAIVTLKDGTGANTAPTSNAGSSFAVDSGAQVTLDGRASTDADGDTLDYAWRQLLGPAVSLSAPNADVTTFTAPAVSNDTLLRFELTVNDTTGASDTSTVSVTVRSPASSIGSSGGGGGSAPLLVAFIVAVGLLRRYRSTTFTH